MSRHYGDSECRVAVDHWDDPWEELKRNAEKLVGCAIYDPEGRSSLPVEVALDVDVGADSSNRSLLCIWNTLPLGSQKEA